MLAAYLAATALAGCEVVPFSRFEFEQAHMGAPCRIVVYAQDAADADAASRAAFDRIEALESALSDYDAESELSLLPTVATGRPHRPSKDLFAVLERSAEIHAATAGAFDPTVGPLVRLWRRARRLRELPTVERLGAAKTQCGMDQVVLDPERRTVQLLKPFMQFDLGGIGKGYAAGAALDVLRARGLPQALVDLGGDMALGAAPPDRDGWTVRAVPLGQDDPDPLFLILSDVGVATSGDANRATEIDGVRYSHIVDPRTGIGLTSRVGVTVVAADATTADALASAASVLGEAGMAGLVESFPGIGIALRTRDGRTITAGSIEGF